MDTVIIREATVADIPAIINASLTSVASKDETNGFSAPEWATYHSSEALRNAWGRGNKLKDGSEVVVAEKKGKIVGFIVFKREPDYVYIDNIDITRDEQRKGVGKALVAYVEGVAFASGYSCVKTDTTENAQGVPWKSYGFWTRMGYVDTNERIPTKWSFKTIPFVKKLKQ
jgi:ribosomal protein S18 acetylase RimI-like enzyme